MKKYLWYLGEQSSGRVGTWGLPGSAWCSKRWWLRCPSEDPTWTWAKLIGSLQEPVEGRYICFSLGARVILYHATPSVVFRFSENIKRSLQRMNCIKMFNMTNQLYNIAYKTLWFRSISLLKIRQNLNPRPPTNSKFLSVTYLPLLHISTQLLPSLALSPN